MKKLIFALFLLISIQALAADLVGISKLFKDSFWTDHYEARYCGKNIEKLVKKAMDQNLDLSGAEIIQITDSSGFMFGMVNALLAREGGSYIEPRQTNPTLTPGESNWYFHVVLKVEGKILDYDFTNEARILAEKKYFLEMFIPKDEQSDAEYRAFKMKGYKITTYPAEEYIQLRESRMSTDSIESKYSFKDYLPEFF